MTLSRPSPSPDELDRKPDPGYFFGLELPEVERVVAGFEATTLPERQWIHATHLLVGLWYLVRHDSETTLRLLRRRIRRYNEATGLGNTDHQGYHETITRFYVQQLREYVDRSGHATDFLLLLRGLNDHPLGHRDFILRYYTKSRLMDPRARHGWVPPNRAPSAGT